MALFGADEEKTVEEQAIHEIVSNLVQRGDGRVWIEDWRRSYSSLGPTPKDFMEQRPDIFHLNMRGRGYSVELVGDGEQMAKDMGAAAPAPAVTPGGSKGGAGGVAPRTGGIVIADHLGPEFRSSLGLGGKGGGCAGPFGGAAVGKGAGFSKGPVANYGVIVPGVGGAAPATASFGGGGKFGPVAKGGGGKGPSLAALAQVPADPTEAAEVAIAEIREQLARRKDNKVWIEDWRERYRMLGPSPKQFMDSRPDVFRLVHDGSRYSVFLAEPGEEGPAPAPSPFRSSGPISPVGLGAASKGGGEALADEETCIDEISRLVAASSDGRIWIPDWFRRFAHLAKTPKAFMESRPDVFALSFRGNAYSVSLLDREIGPVAPEPEPPKKRPSQQAGLAAELAKPRPMKSAKLAPRQPLHAPSKSVKAAAAAAAVASSALEFLGDKEEDALVEIFDQLSKLYSNGRVSFPNWAQRFGHLAGTPREFIESHPDKFEVVPGYGGSYTVELC